MMNQEKNFFLFWYIHVNGIPLCCLVVMFKRKYSDRYTQPLKTNSADPGVRYSGRVYNETFVAVC